MLFRSSEPTKEKIEQFIQSSQLTVEQLGELRKLEMQFQNDEKERNFRYAELTTNDVADARHLAEETKSRTPAVLSYCVLLGGSAMIVAVMLGYAKADDILVGTLIGFVIAEMKQVLSYWFGSSVGSKDKSDALTSVFREYK